MTKKFIALTLVIIGFALLVTPLFLQGQGVTGGQRRQIIFARAGVNIGPNGVKVSQLRCGVTGAMTAGSITVADTTVTANTIILLTGLAQGGTAGALRVQSRVAGTSFTVTSSSGTDTSTLNYCMFEP